MIFGYEKETKPNPMKNLLLFIALLASGSLMAQVTFNVEKIEASAVPSEVSDAFNQKFPDVKDVRWELHTATSGEHSGDKYVCIFDNADNIRSRARYRNDGKGISATTYFWFKNVEKLPQAIKDFCAINYEGFKLSAGELEMSLKKDRSAYRIKLRKGRTKITVWLDESGNEINEKNIDSELHESENETSEN